MCSAAHLSQSSYNMRLHYCSIIESRKSLSTHYCFQYTSNPSQCIRVSLPAPLVGHLPSLLDLRFFQLLTVMVCYQWALPFRPCSTLDHDFAVFLAQTWFRSNIFGRHLEVGIENRCENYSENGSVLTNSITKAIRTCVLHLHFTPQRVPPMSR